MPAISIIIPIYNAERTIRETLKSLRFQTFADFEIIAVDDGSTDQTVEILQQIQDKRLKVFSYSNAGTAIARNRGIQQSSGDFVAFLDADDLWTPDKLERQLEVLQTSCPQAEVAYSWVIYFFDGKWPRYFKERPVFFEGNVYADLLIRNFVTNGSNPLIRRRAIDSIGGFDQTCWPCEDWDFYLRLAASCRFALVPKHQIYYRKSPLSASGNLGAMEKAGFKTIEKAYRAAPAELQSLKRQSLAQFYEYCTQQHLQSTHAQGFMEARQRLWQAICLYPPILLKPYTYDLTLQVIKRWMKTNLVSPIV
jgi:glycosyltransferase involved in cell wall biosynthesis